MTRRNRRPRTILAGLALASVLACLTSAPALAAPAFEVELSPEASEIQSVRVSATGGQFRLLFGPGGIGGVAETGDLSATASAAEVQSALNALSNVSAGGGSVSVKLVSTPKVKIYLITFDGGSLRYADVPQLKAINGTVPLSGGTPPTGAKVVTLRTSGTSRSDERLDYVVAVKNVSATGAAASEGDLLFCAGAEPIKTWSPLADQPKASFTWWRNGEIIPGETSELHIVTSEDAGKALQCLVTGSNSAGASMAAALPPAVIDPQPAIAPPAPGDPPNDPLLGKDSRPTITDPAGEDRIDLEKGICHPPANWTPGTTYTYQWLLNAEPIETAEAETAEYQPVSADEGKILQCRVVGSNTGGAIVGVSNNSSVGSVSGAPLNIPTSTPEVIADPTTVEVELPGGATTRVFEASGGGWACKSEPPLGVQHARAICAAYEAVGPGSSYKPITVATALDPATPDPAVAKATVTGNGSPEAAIDEDSFSFKPALPFGLSSFEAAVLDPAGNSETQAGGHPFVGVGNFTLNMKRQLKGENNQTNADFVPIEHVKQVVTDLPRGFVGNALAVPELCGSVDQAIPPSTCPASSRVGVIRVIFSGTPESAARFPIYAIEPEDGTPAQFAFPAGTPGSPRLFTLSTRLRPKDNYAISLELAPSPVLDVLEAEARICNFGVTGSESEPSCREGGEPGANPKPLFTNPTRCGSPPPTAAAHLDSWEHPGEHGADGLPLVGGLNWVSYEAPNPEVTGCEKVHFDPAMALNPTTKRADTPTGLDIDLTMPTDGLEGKDEEGNPVADPETEAISQANLKKAVVTFPKGMAINASAGQNLGACSSEQIKMGTNLPISCPESSKIGTVEIETPIIADTLHGAVYIAKQGEVNGSLIGLYLVFESPKNGILIKVPGTVSPDPQTGQLTVTVDESPEDPFSAVRMHFPGGDRATLITPPSCGTKTIKAELYPYSGGAPVVQESTFQVTEGPNGAPCPSNPLPLLPQMRAGVGSPLAGHTSPFALHLSRDDATQRFDALSVHTPPGLSAYLKGIPYCPDAALASISSAPGTGGAQIESPSCPAASQIGTAVAGAGAGPDPLYVDTGKVYLAGPYKGAPLSLAVVAPAVAGPLDLGNVVVRNAIRLNPETAQVSAISDPIPTILHGLLLDVRDIRVVLDRPGFTLNPTSCEQMAVRAEVHGESGGKATLSAPFQVGGCDALAFKPKLGLHLFGPTGRGGFPRLNGTLAAGPGEANIARAAVTIPRSEFLEQGHIRTICTRVQFAAKACPQGSIYGHATATTPLLDYPVSGPVYLRSSDNELPDVVAALRGPDWQPIEAVVVGRVDSVKGQIRTTFEAAPDVPVSSFTLQMQGGRKGLLVNSRDVCATANRATVVLEGHNGMVHRSRPVVRNGKCGKERGAKKRHRRQSKRP